MSSIQKRQHGPLFLILFALPFLGGGLFTIGLTVRTLERASTMAHWPEAPATIIETELQENHGDSTTYQVKARYRYEVDGLAHEGTRVGLHRGSDNIGSWHQDRYRELRAAQSDGQPVTCRINPADPTDAILYPEARTSMLLFYSLFGVIFGGVGVGAIWGSIYQRRKQRAAAEAPPDTPWVRRKDWAEGLVRASNHKQVIFFTGFAVFWNLVSWPALLANSRTIFAQGGLALLVLLFPVIGLGLAAWAVREILVMRRYGKAVFQMATVPGVLGGRLAGLIRLPESARPEDGFVVSIACERTYSSGKHSHTETRWKDERRLDAETVPTDDHGQALPVLFALPYELPESEAWFNRGRVNWRLRVKARQPGVDVDLLFDVPVFKTPASRPGFVLDEKPIAAYEQRV